MKKMISSSILSLAFFTMLSTPVFAYTYTKQTLSDGSVSVTQVDDAGQSETRVFAKDDLVHITLNGANLDSKFDVPPFIENSRTLLPIGQLARLLNANVMWDSNKQQVTIKSNTSVNNQIVTMTIGSKTATLNGENFNMDVAPEIIMGRTVVPVRFIQYAFSNLSVSWDADNRNVILTQSN